MDSAMLRYVLIGGIGSGKTSVSNLFLEQGAYCIDLDTIGHRQLFDPNVKRELVETFGAEILDDARQIDRARLAERAFASSEATAALNAITHPRVISMLKKRLDRGENAGSGLCIVESSAYAGPASVDGLDDLIDGIIAVVADEELRVQRAVARGMDEADVRARMARQATDEERRAWADYVIENNGTLAALEAQVAELYDSLVSV
ncbi:MAG: dephospho-CoA kinase [Eggerthellaceae bacterium]|nr:dephospho-CoA kinase [Eggerthellaceae bacterium]